MKTPSKRAVRRNKFRIPPNIVSLYHQNLKQRKAILNLPQPKKEEAKYGQIWTTKFEFSLPDGTVKKVNETRLVIILPSTGLFCDEYFCVLVAPISLDGVLSGLDNATDLDFVLVKEFSPLGYEVMVELWNFAYIFATNLDRCMGEIREERILIQLKALLGKAKIIKDGEMFDAAKIDTRNIPTGTPILDQHDLRLEFQARERVMTEYLREQNRWISDKLL